MSFFFISWTFPAALQTLCLLFWHLNLAGTFLRGFSGLLREGFLCGQQDVFLGNMGLVFQQHCQHQGWRISCLLCQMCKVFGTWTFLSKSCAGKLKSGQLKGCCDTSCFVFPDCTWLNFQHFLWLVSSKESHGPSPPKHPSIFFPR